LVKITLWGDLSHFVTEKEKLDKIKVNGSDNLRLKDECDTSSRQDMKVKWKHLTKKVQSIFYISTLITCV
jgi:hypothetical protein